MSLPAAQAAAAVALSRMPPPEVAKRETLRGFITRSAGAAFEWPRHVAVMVDAIQRWIDGEFDHLSISIPPQHAKTTCGPRWAGPYILSRHPTLWVGVVSYNQDIASLRGLEARNNWLAAGGQAGDLDRQSIWSTSEGGGMWAAGSEAAITGRSASVLMLDDGDKDHDEAVNPRKQARKRYVYAGVLRQRESMFARDAQGTRARQKILITSTRWDREDLTGFVLRKGEETGERWAILNLPAVYDPKVGESLEQLFPSATILPDWRTDPGEPIWPEMIGRAEWAQKRNLVTPIIWESEIQQNPLGVQTGGHIDRAWFWPVDRNPAHEWDQDGKPRAAYSHRVRAWDIGHTEGAGDATAGVKMGLVSAEGELEGKRLVEHVVAAQLGPRRVEQMIVAAAIVDGPDVVIRLTQDPAAGKALAEAHQTAIETWMSRCGLPCPRIVIKAPRRASTAEMTAKQGRAQPLISRAQPPGQGMRGQIGYVSEPWQPTVEGAVPDYEAKATRWPELRSIAKLGELLRRRWSPDWLAECHAFSGVEGGKDDQVDATVDASDEIDAQLGAVASGPLPVRTRMWAT